MYLKKISTLAFVLALFGAGPGQAQWVTESYQLKEGWNAIWFPHDVSHDTIDNLFPASVTEVWRWNPVSDPNSTVSSPVNPGVVQPDTPWLVWKRGFPADSTLNNLPANSAFLVKVADSTSTFAHEITGKATPPQYRWASSGQNLFGFSTTKPGTNFQTFASYSDALSVGAELFKYDGGSITENPTAIDAPLSEEVVRGQAYWIRSSKFTNYYGPLQIEISESGLNYGDTGSFKRFRIKNVTSENVTATLTPTDSATPPTGQTQSAGAVPLRLRGALDPTTGQFAYSDFSGAVSIEIAAGGEVELVFSIKRAAMSGTAGTSFQSLVQVSDSLGLTRLNLPVSATIPSRSGLWIGTAVVTKVDQITAAPAVGGVDVTTKTDAQAPSSYPIRLIVHRDATGLVRLLQQTYLGTDLNGNIIVAANESSLDPASLKNARRVSSASFPLDAKISGTGDLGLTGTAAFSSTLAHTAATNPFLHTYHPDHDNKDAQFNPVPLPEGLESYTVTRAITCSFISDPATLGLNEPGWGSTVLGGTYNETLTGLRAQPIKVSGSFVLTRVSDISTLTE